MGSVGWTVSKEETCACRIGDLDPGIKTLSTSLLEILLRLENDLVDAGGDLELGCLFRALGVARGEQLHAATVRVSDAEERRGQRRASRKKMGGLLRDRIEHAEITPVTVNLEADVDTLGGLPEGDVEDCRRQRAVNGGDGELTMAADGSLHFRTSRSRAHFRTPIRSRTDMTSSPPLGKYLASSGVSLVLRPSLSSTFHRQEDKGQGSQSPRPVPLQSRKRCSPRNRDRQVVERIVLLQVLLSNPLASCLTSVQVFGCPTSPACNRTSPRSWPSSS